MGSAFSRSPVGCQWPVAAVEDDAAELADVAASLLEELEVLGEPEELEEPAPLEAGPLPDPVTDAVTNPPLAPTVPDSPPHPCVRASPVAVAHMSVIFRIRRENARAPLIRMPVIVPSGCLRGKGS
ncbi:MAG: hypothetical protein HOV83_32825 [Catenulispora sp.]|nr:hypothetical protein [Catenulispora sp.]